MTDRIVLPMPGNAVLATRIAATGAARLGEMSLSRFPDGESHVRIESDVRGRAVFLVSTQLNPDPDFLAMVFAADALRELGALSVGLIAPYLAYMRQDQRFAAGEAVTSRSYARWLSRAMNSVVTVDPHLHRLHSLSAIFDIPTTAIDVAPLLASWINCGIENPLVVGPDAESAQWVRAVAEPVGLPWVVAEKVRHDSEHVSVRFSDDLNKYRRHTPVLVDDIISTGHSMAEAAAALAPHHFVAPVCVAVHAVFAHGAEATLHRAGIDRVVTTNTI